MKILHCTSEFYPYIKMGGLSDMLSGLAKSQSQTHEVSVAIPLIRGLKVEPHFTGKKIPAFDPNTIPTTIVGEILKASQFLEAEIGSIKLYFFDSPLFSDLDKIYENPEEHFRFAVYSYACFHLGLTLQVDLVHAHDWHTALVCPLNTSSPYGKPSVFTIHNLAYQGDHPEWMTRFLREAPFFLRPDTFSHLGKTNYMLSALWYARQITTVSPGYRDETLKEPMGMGLSGVLQWRQPFYTGILNGLDEEEWNPESDQRILNPYSSKTVDEGKQKNKEGLLQEIGRKIDPNRPVVGIIGRLTYQKGYKDFFLAFLERVHLPYFYIFLGAGDPELENHLLYHSHHSQDRIFFYKGYDEVLARKIEASSDFFLMPSLFEPCGLNQLYSHRYASIPLVSRVGGLKDTVKEIPGSKENTGFVFEPNDSASLGYALERAYTFFQDKTALKDMRQRIMKLDWGWKRRVEEYNSVYGRAIH